MLILHNAKIYTLNPDQPEVSALAIQPAADHGGRIVAAGDTEELNAEFGGRARMEDLEGHAVLPGLTDAHLHFLNYARGLKYVDCDTRTRSECIARVAARARNTAAGQWIRGHGWRQNDWPEGFGAAAMLDEAAPHNPVYLTAASLHAGWANQAALKAAGIGEDTPDPPNGHIQRDERGQATGILFESAMALVAEAIPQPSHDENQRAMLAAQTELWRMGLTGLHDFDRDHSFRALQSLREQGELGLRVLKHLPVELLDEILAVGLRSGFGDDLLRIGAIKVFADGALGPRTAAMYEPYTGEPENRGMLFVDREELLESAQRAALGGLGMSVHAIGDRANHEVLDAFEQLRQFEKERGLPARRHRIEHVQLMHPDDVGRLGTLGIGASMQPSHAPADMQAAEKYWGERCQYAYAWRRQLDAGATLAFGSDAPVEWPNPFRGLHAAVTRRREDGGPGAEGWFPEQRLKLDEALRAFTFGPATLAGMEDRLGRLAPGRLADLIVLDEDPFEIDPHNLKDLQPTATMVGGEWVWTA